MKYFKLFENFLNEGSAFIESDIDNGSFGDKNQFTWIYDKPFKNLTVQEQGHKSRTGFKELVIKKIEDREVKKLIDEIQYEDYLSWNIIKSIVKKYHPEFEVINEGISQEAVLINTITGSGQNGAQDFIDDNNIDAKKLADYLVQHKNSKEKYDIRDLIKDPKSNKRLLKKFVKESIDTKYWAEYNTDTTGQAPAEFSNKTTEFEDTFEDAVVAWNQEAERENMIKGGQIQDIKKLAEEFFKKEKWISVNVIHAMIAQES